MVKPKRKPEVLLDEELDDSKARVEVYGKAWQKKMLVELADVIGKSRSQTVWLAIDTLLNHEEDGRLAELKRRAKNERAIAESKSSERTTGDYLGSFDKIEGKLVRVDRGLDEGKIRRKMYILATLEAYNSYEKSQATVERDLSYKFGKKPPKRIYTPFYKYKCECPNCLRIFFRVRRKADEEDKLWCTNCSTKHLRGKTVDWEFEDLKILKKWKLTKYAIPEEMRLWEHEDTQIK